MKEIQCSWDDLDLLGIQIQKPELVPSPLYLSLLWAEAEDTKLEKQIDSENILIPSIWIVEQDKLLFKVLLENKSLDQATS